MASTICLSLPWKVGSQPRPAASRSLPVMTAFTPGTFSASLMSMFVMFGVRIRAAHDGGM
jgi:hypothetical protein